MECNDRMRISKIIGNVTLNRVHPELSGGTLKLAIPLSLTNITGESDTEADTIVVYDELGAGLDSQILLSESREASQPFHPNTKPIDAYNAAILDKIYIADQ